MTRAACMMHHTFMNHRLLDFVRRALLMQPPEPVSRKRRPSQIWEVGPEAAMKYRARKRMSRGCGSTLKKTARALRIEAGVRPLKYEVLGKRERLAAFARELVARI